VRPPHKAGTPHKASHDPESGYCGIKSDSSDDMLAFADQWIPSLVLCARSELDKELLPLWMPLAAGLFEGGTYLEGKTNTNR
jgi:hypothetical protein